MTLNQRRLLPSTSALAAFEAVARLGSFSAAAEELALTQGAVSRQIALLEDLLQMQLFTRGNRGVTPTAEAQAYARSIAEALLLIRSSTLEAMTKSQGNSLTLAILPTFGTRWLMPRIRSFVAAHPDVTLSFATRIGKFDFDAEGIDAAIHIGAPDWPGAQCTFLMNELVEPMCSPAFRRQNPVAKPADFAGLTLIHLASRAGAWDHWFRSLGVETPPSRSMRLETFATAAQACIAGLGVALLPRFLVESELASGALVPLYPHPVVSPSAYYLVAPRARSHRRPIAQFRAWLLEQVAAADAPAAGKAATVTREHEDSTW
jgi:DNA-binding transcriptional LysR family regulator